jgi:predicted RNA-binding protein with PIN domain
VSVDLPNDVASDLVRLVGHYLRATPPRSLPASVRALRQFRPQALQKRRAAVLGALDDDELRAGIIEWLDDGSTPLSREEAGILRIAADRPDDWVEQLAGSSRAAPAGRGSRSEPDAQIATKLERAEERAKKARAEARRAKEEARREADRQREEVLALSLRVDELTASLQAAEDTAADERRRATDAQGEADRIVRRARRELDDARAEAEAGRKRSKALERERTTNEARIRELESEVESLRTSLVDARRASPSDRPEPRPRKRRSPLPVPRGRLPEDPQTLYEWLSADGVRLFIDGYNVTKTEGGFGDLTLESQRERLIDEVLKLASRVGVPTTIVFDGSEVAPASTRRLRGALKIEYSRPGEIADDHLVALLERGVEPAILVTNDRDLQERAEKLGATIATSDQLLSVIR